MRQSRSHRTQSPGGRLDIETASPHLAQMEIRGALLTVLFVVNAHPERALEDAS
jgi:hypothetical protein